MIKLTGLKATPYQTLSIASPNGDGDITIELIFRSRVNGWFMNLSFGLKKIYGLKIVRGFNILSQYANSIGFGMTVNVSDFLEPYLINDLSTERVVLRLLTAEEVALTKSNVDSGALY